LQKSNQYWPPIVDHKAARTQALSVYKQQLS
jgi:deoxyribodipyrimidine photolyase